MRKETKKTIVDYQSDRKEVTDLKIHCQLSIVSYLYPRKLKNINHFMKNALILSALLTLGPVCFAQQTEKYPLGNYEELTDTKPHDGAEVWNKMTTPTCLSWGTTDIRYKKLNVPDIKKTTRWNCLLYTSPSPRD